MPKSKIQKQEALKSLEEKLKDSKAVVFSSDTGSNVKTIESLRKELKANNAEYLVVKKTLLKKAIKDMGETDQLDQLAGSVALTLSYQDEVSAAKILNKYAKDSETLKMAGGILEKSFIMPEMVKRLATLPSREELLTKLVGSLNSSISGLVRVLAGTTRNFVGVLRAIKDSKNN
ncbi:MAG: 50S ribosomal protein L10 [Candidatus Komeilibacteria bacterium RIFOXYC1_FULL_37_11]|uniref:Large ribosomal subunit protein uL10 n=1 Tax=Candidatus Komeilibacteria bacterium RIFOXYC1_FULL_37_11 TaxID=1798555 RepID=A0A1G2BZF6_9BACT|nr:MAG: 50S ribosomal protein L10 [Candidatus Komeilibacteria bacterium RIFOXYC1_FULL_37_11]OGY95846.1 MAG: 50S ribosomal protein L10 [Candidatus Komeilibacteria bacterium RIFOXYD1_FULL_37_29]